MKLVIATGIFPPEVGGPAQYAYRLSKEFETLGHRVVVIRYGALKHLPSGVRHALYACRLFFNTLGADAIIAFDTYSVGVPAGVVSRMLGIPLVIRVGGDFLWEQYTNRTKEMIPLPLFYDDTSRWNAKDGAVYRLTRGALRGARLAFNTTWLATVWTKAYAFPPESVHVVENVCMPYEQGAPAVRKNFLFYSRTVPLKNHDAFRAAFLAVQKTHPDIELEEGVVSHEALQEKIRSCYAVVVPSISDVAPNYVLEAIRYGKPFILTKYSGYAERFQQMGVIVDPLDVQDMQRGIEALLAPDTYARCVAAIQRFDTTHTYTDIAREFLALIHSA